jgi:hypothetical protein
MWKVLGVQKCTEAQRRKTLESLFRYYWENKPQYICRGACATKKKNIKQTKKMKATGFSFEKGSWN